MEGKRARRPLLLDSGATSNFVAADFVAANALTPESLRDPLTVRMANGQPVPCTTALRQAEVAVPGYTGRYDLLVLPDLDGFDAILGRPFLRGAGAIVDHAAGSVSWKAAAARPAQPRRVLLASVNSAAVRDAEFVCELVAGVGPSMQQGVLGAFGLTTEPGDEATVSATAATSPLREALMKRVNLYDSRMQPLVGRLPPSRGEFDHRIELKDAAAAPSKRRAIPLSQSEQAVLKKQLDKLQAAGLIRPSRSPWAAPVFFVPKEGASEPRMVVDYRGLNELTVKNAASLPHVKELLARVGVGRWFTKLDLKSGYHQVRLRETDIPLTGFVTPHGHFEWLVMPFGESNAPATFTQLMAQLVLPDLLDSCVIVFQDDILVFSSTEDDHVAHVGQVLDRLERHSLFLKPEKCEWMQRSANFLGYTIRSTSTGTVIDTVASKVDAIRDWPVPRTVTQLRAFLGICNFYREFVDGHSRIAAPLTRLTASPPRRAPLTWTAVEQAAFDALKAALCAAPALVVADDDKPFVLHVDACSYAVGAVLSQHDREGILRPVGFFSKKFTDTQYRWDTYEKELFSIVAALEHWSWHLRNSRHEVVIHTDHRSLEKLLQQPRLSGKQTRWLLFLSLYKFQLVYVAGEANVVADALSRRCDHDDGAEHRQRVQAELAKQEFVASGSTVQPAMRAVSIASSSAFADEVRAAYEQDDECRGLLASPEDDGYTLRDGLLYRHDGFGILVPPNADLRARLLREAHDAPASGHLGGDKTHARLAGSWYWPGMRRDVREYVGSCRSCQANKSVNAKPSGLLMPIPVVPKGHTLTMDFIGPLPRTSRGNDYILVIVDRFSKKAWYEPCKSTITAKQTAEIVFRRVVTEQLLPTSIISDRDARFTSAFWKELWTACGTKLSLSTAYHPQSDGQSERQNRTLEEMLRAYVNDRGSDWDRRLVHCEIAYNSARHSSTGFTPIRLHSGVDGRSPLNIAAPLMRERGVATGASDFLDSMAQDARVATECLAKAQKRMKRFADRHRRAVEFAVGDRAYMSGADLKLRGQGSQKLRPRYEGPFPVTAVDNDGLDVTLELPPGVRIHPHFHVDRLRRAVEVGPERFPGREQRDRPLPQLSPDPNDDNSKLDDSKLDDSADSDGLDSDHSDGGGSGGDEPDTNDVGGENNSEAFSDDSPIQLRAPRTRSNVHSRWDRGLRYEFAAL